jgi:hypothetical protein
MTEKKPKEPASTAEQVFEAARAWYKLYRRFLKHLEKRPTDYNLAKEVRWANRYTTLQGEASKAGRELFARCAGYRKRRA